MSEPAVPQPQRPLWLARCFECGWTTTGAFPGMGSGAKRHLESGCAGPIHAIKEGDPSSLRWLRRKEYA